MKFQAQKKLAARIKKVGVGRIWLDPLRLEDVKQAITRGDIKDLIKDKAIKVKPKTKKAKSKGKPGKKGTGRIRKRIRNRKAKYVSKIRKIRRYLDYVCKNKEITKKEKDKLRKLAKSGHFRSLKHLKESMKPTV